MEIVKGSCETLGRELRDVNLNLIDQDAVREILAAIHEHSMVLFTDQHLTVREFREMGLKLGAIMPYPDPRYRHPEYEGVFVSSNEKSRGMGMARSGYFWHSDLSFMRKPQPLTVLFPRLLPEATRETLFINMADVYDAMPSHLREIVDNHTAEHDPVLRYKVGQSDVDAHLDIGELIDNGRRAFPAPTHPCVITHPVNKRRCLYMNNGFVTKINGLKHEESQAALKEIFEFINRPEHVHTHTWGPDQMIMWDNRMLIHRAGEMVGEATFFRLGIDDLVPFYEGIVTE